MFHSYSPKQKLLYIINFCRNKDWGKRVSEICLKNYMQIFHRKAQNYKDSCIIWKQKTY